MKSVITTALVTLATLASVSANASIRCGVQSKQADGSYSGPFTSVELQKGQSLTILQEGELTVAANVNDVSLNIAAYNMNARQIKALGSTAADAKHLAVYLPEIDKMAVCFELK